MDGFFIVNYGEQEFTDSKHLNNFIKYLFSKSKNHTKNDLTKYCFYKRKEQNKFKVGFLEDNDTKYNSFISNLNIQDYINFRNDLFDIYFIVEIGGSIVTNLFSIEKLDDSNVSLKILINNDSLGYILDNYFNSNESEFNDYLIDIITKANDRSMDFINYYNLLKEDKNNLGKNLIKEIENKLHSNIQKNNYNEKVIYQVSHNDQLERPYHIHRLILNEK